MWFSWGCESPNLLQPPISSLMTYLREHLDSHFLSSNGLMGLATRLEEHLGTTWGPKPEGKPFEKLTTFVQYFGAVHFWKKNVWMHDRFAGGFSCSPGLFLCEHVRIWGAKVVVFKVSSRKTSSQGRTGWNMPTITHKWRGTDTLEFTRLIVRSSLDGS